MNAFTRTALAIALVLASTSAALAEPVVLKATVSKDVVTDKAAGEIANDDTKPVPAYFGSVLYSYYMPIKVDIGNGVPIEYYPKLTSTNVQK